MASYGLLQPLSSVTFERKLKFSASRDLVFTKSKSFKIPEAESCNDRAWDIKPPDFSVKLYSCKSLSQKKGRKSTSSEVSQHAKAKTAGTTLPNLVRVNPKRKDPPKFTTSYRPPDALQSELLFVKTGKYHSGAYKNPKPYNFRPLDEERPDIFTTYERDPGNLNLKRKSLDTLRITRSEIDFSYRDPTARMDTYKPAEPDWDSKLLLPLSPWPPKSASYTRHQRRRGAYSALLDRMEEKLSRSWTNKS